MIIKKFKNGKIKLVIETYDKIYYGDGVEVNSEDIYPDCMEMDDLSINQINGYQYIVDYNTQTVYELHYYLQQNPIKWLLKTLNNNNVLYLHPLSKKESKVLMQNLENGY